jgi:hypothetical protein
MSGYTANVIAHQGILDDEVAFIQKPFSIADLAEKLRDLLDISRIKIKVNYPKPKYLKTHFLKDTNPNL